MVRIKQLAILMTCHNRKEKTIKCLQHLFQQVDSGIRYNLEVFLVDDGSTDGTSNLVRQTYPEVNIIQGDGNLYWNRGMHVAWEAATKFSFDAFVWLNDDTYLYKSAIIELINSMEETNAKSIICGMIESPTIKGEVTYGGGTHVNRKFVMNKPLGKLQSCNIINGNCVLVPIDVHSQVGNLDWSFIHSIGDNDYSLRAKKLGILSYTTGIFIGTCSKSGTFRQWCQPNVLFIKRLENLYSPLGHSHPFQYFRFEFRHFGILLAIKHFISIHLRVAFPKLWK